MTALVLNSRWMWVVGFAAPSL